MQQPNAKVDLLFVIDATQSMSQELSALASSFSALVEGLEQRQLSWQVGVVEMNDPVLRGSPWVITSTTKDPVEQFLQMLPNTSNLASQAGVSTLKEAVSLCEPGLENAGFRRPDAVFHAIIVSDGDDQSDLPDPVAEALQIIASQSAVAPARVSAVVGDLPSGCSSSLGQAGPGAIYSEIVGETGGWLGSICEPDMRLILENLGEASVTLPASFTLQHDPFVDSLQVLVDSAQQPFTVTGRVVLFDTAPAAGSNIVISYLTDNI